MKTKRPGSLRNPGLCEQSVEGAYLYACLARMHLAMVPLKPLLTRRKHRIKGAAAGAGRLHRPGTHGRRQTRYGSVACGGVPGSHDETFPGNGAVKTAWNCNANEL